MHLTRNSSRLGVLGAALLVTTLFPSRVVRADLGYWSRALTGTWRHPTNGDCYRFGSDATYTFTAGPAKRKSGQLSHSGFWRMSRPTEEESDGSLDGIAALILDSKSRIVRRGKNRVVLDSNRSFRLIVVNAQDANGEPTDDAFYIGRAKWIRVR